MSIFERNSV